MNDDHGASKHGSLQDFLDRQTISQLIHNWAIWRDSGNWDAFRTVWHEDGRMQATWTEGSVEQFIAATIDGWDRGVKILHFIGGITVDLAGDRAIAQTKMQISQRADVESVACDVLCMARAYDFFERRAGRWGLVFREPIYEKDRLDPVNPRDTLQLDQGLLDSFPEGYRHLAYLQTRLGYAVRRDLPGIQGPEVERLYARGAAWLKGEA